MKITPDKAYVACHKEDPRPRTLDGVKVETELRGITIFPAGNITLTIAKGETVTLHLLNGNCKIHRVEGNKLTQPKFNWITRKGLARTLNPNCDESEVLITNPGNKKVCLLISRVEML